MNAYKHMLESFQNEYKTRDQALKNRIMTWRKESPVEKVERPTNIARARELGYKAKQGIVMARVRVGRGLSNALRQPQLHWRGH